MNEGFDLGTYWGALRREWRVATAVIVAALVVSLIASALRPVRYRARVVLLAPPPKYLWRLDYNFQSISPDLRLDRRRDFATFITDEHLAAQLAQDVLQAVGDQLPEDLRDPELLMEWVSVDIRAGRIMYLDSWGPTPELAQILANAWADALIRAVAAMYGQTPDIEKFAAELEKAREDLAHAQEALTRFRSETGLDLDLGGALAAPEADQLYAGLSPAQQELVHTAATWAMYQDALTRLKLFSERMDQVLSVGGDIDLLPWELLDHPLLRERRGLQSVIAAPPDPTAVREAIDAELHELGATAEALAMQQRAISNQVAEDLATLDDLQRAYQRAEEAVNALERKLIELPIQAELEEQPLMMARSAALPKAPASPNWLLNVISALVVGTLLGGSLALMRGLPRPSRER